MKRIISTLAAAALITVNVFAAPFSQPIPDSVMRPAPGLIETVLVNEDFEGTLNTSKWSGIYTSAQSDGNNAGVVAPDKIASYGLGTSWFGDHCVRMNAKLDYAAEGWPEILDLRFKNDNTKCKIMVYQSKDKATSRIYLQTAGQSSNLWYSHDLPAEHPIFNGEWFFIKAEVKEDAVNVYLDGEDNPVIEASGLTLANAAIGFKPFKSTLYIDNLLVTREKNLPRETVVPEISAERVTLAYRDSADMPYSSGNILTENFTAELNVKAQYTDGGKYKESYFSVTAGDYKFVFKSSASGGSGVSLMKNGAELALAEGDGYKNHAEADMLWAYIKIEKQDGVITLYFNDKQKPSYTFSDPEPSSGGVFSADPGTVTALEAKNIYISAPMGTKMLAVTKISGSTVKVSSKYETAAQAAVLAVSADGKTVGKLDITAAPSVLDGGDFTASDAVFDFEPAYAFAVDMQSDFDYKTAVELSCDDENLYITCSTLSPDGIFAAVDGGLTAAYLPGESGTVKLSGIIPEGEHTLTVYDGSKTPAVTDFQYISRANIAEFLSKLNSDFVSAFSMTGAKVYLKYFGVLFTDYDASPETVCGLVPENTVFTAENTGDILNEAMLLALFADSKTAAEQRELFNKYKDKISPEPETEKLILSAKTDITDEIFSGMYSRRKECKSYKSVSDLYTCQAVLSLIYKSGFADIYQILEKYEGVLGIDLSKAPSNENERNKMMTKLNQNRCYTYEEFAQLYNDSLPKSAPKPVSGGGGGGGGGGVSAPKNDAPSTSEVTYGGQLPEPAKPRYSDVPREHWAYEYITELSDNEIISGYPDGNFYPENNVTRAEMCKLITAAFDIKSDDAPEFDDVEKTDWFYGYVSRAAAFGIVNGFDGSFNPGEYITRQDAAVMLYRLITKTKSLEVKNADFADASDISDYAKDAVCALYGAGVINGSGDSFMPLSDTTRAEAAKLISAVKNIIGR